MGWLARRAFVVWLILIVICAGLVGIVRANGGPGRMGAMGFGVCDGGTCFRGIKVGMSWSETARLIPDATEIGPPIIFNFGSADEALIVLVYPSDDGKTVWGIVLEGNSLNSRLSAGDVVQHFGYPCRVELSADYIGGAAMLVYPHHMSSLFVDDFRLSAESSVWAIAISEPIGSDPCSRAQKEQSGPWRGFTSGDVYFARNRRDLRSKP
jgi:hypothetical protein